MPIVGFNYDKIQVEKKNQLSDKMNIQSNVSITDVKEEQMPTGKTKADGLRFNFEYNIKYGPDIGEINLAGFIFYMDDSKILKDIIKGWKKDKSLPDRITLEIINSVLFKSTIRALALSQEVNLPPHLPVIPRAKPGTKPKDYIG